MKKFENKTFNPARMLLKELMPDYEVLFKDVVTLQDMAQDVINAFIYNRDYDQSCSTQKSNRKNSQ
jgi:hypothetical protein